MKEKCQWCIKHAETLNFWGNLSISSFLMFCAIFSNSRALFADAIHTCADVILALFLVFSVKYSNAPADKEHPYGHGKLEFISSLICGISIFTVGIIISTTSILAILRGELLIPKLIAVPAVIISIAGNELLFRYLICAGEKGKSPALISAAWENRADVYSSIAAFIGITGAMLGFPIMDPIAAIIIGIIIIRIAISVLRDAIKGIMETSLDSQATATLKNMVAGFEAVKGIDIIHARKAGRKILIEIEILVDPLLTINEGKLLTEKIKTKIEKKFLNVEQVLIHLKPA